MVWVRKSKKGNRGLTNDQKLLIESVLFGEMESVEGLSTFLDLRKNNLKTRVINPVVEMGLLEWDGEESLRIPEAFEETLHEIFVESGGEQALTATQEKFGKHREEYQERGEEANEDDRETEEEKRRAAVLRGELDSGQMPSSWSLYRAHRRRA